MTDSGADIAYGVETQTNFTQLFYCKHLFKDIHDWIVTHLWTRQDRKVICDEIIWLFKEISKKNPMNTLLVFRYGHVLLD